MRVLAAIVLGGCSCSQTPEPDSIDESHTPSTAEYMSLEPISRSDMHEVPQSRGEFGYSCTGDCSGHEAGYEWAEENEISDESDCDGNSDSFNEGCQEYVEEQAGEADEELLEDEEGTEE